MELPDYLISQDGEPVYMADLVYQIRNEFRSLEASLAFHHHSNTIIGVLVFHKIKRKYGIPYLSNFGMLAISTAYLHYLLSGDVMFTLRDLKNLGNTFTTTTIWKHVRIAVNARIIEKVSSFKYVITPKGIAIMEEASKEYISRVNKVRHTAWKQLESQQEQL